MIALSSTGFLNASAAITSSSVIPSGITNFFFGAPPTRWAPPRMKSGIFSSGKNASSSSSSSSASTAAFSCASATTSACASAASSCASAASSGAPLGNTASSLLLFSSGAPLENTASLANAPLSSGVSSLGKELTASSSAGLAAFSASIAAK